MAVAVAVAVAVVRVWLGLVLHYSDRPLALEVPHTAPHLDGHRWAVSKPPKQWQPSSTLAIQSLLPSHCLCTHWPPSRWGRCCQRRPPWPSKSCPVMVPRVPSHSPSICIFVLGFRHRRATVQTGRSPVWRRRYRCHTT